MKALTFANVEDIYLSIIFNFNFIKVEFNKRRRNSLGAVVHPDGSIQTLINCPRFWQISSAQQDLYPHCNRHTHSLLGTSTIATFCRNFFVNYYLISQQCIVLF